MSKVTEIVDDLRSIEGATSNLQEQINASNVSKQDVLVSGTNIKTVNGSSVLGTGDINTTQTSVTGNAGTATKLETSRNINGIAFDGTSDITIVDSTKQDTLVSGTNIKKINGDSILGSGNIELGVFTNMAVITVSGKFTTSFTGKHRIYCVGGGGSGGQSNSTSYSNAFGGGAGGISIHEAIFNSGTKITCVIGAGGVAPTVANTNGGNGGTTTVSATDASSTAIILSASGGSGGTQERTSSVSGTASLGGTGTGGNIFNGTGGSGGIITATSTVTTCARATGGGGVPLAPGAITRGGNISGNNNTTGTYGATGGGGAYNRGGDIISLGTSSVALIATGGAGTLSDGDDSSATSGIMATIGGQGFSTNMAKFGSGISGTTGAILLTRTPSGSIGGGGGGGAGISVDTNLYNRLSLPFGGSGGWTATAAANAVQTGSKVGYGGGGGGLAVIVSTAIPTQAGGGDGVVIIEW